ncbi:hypothetical protein BJX76DRAFT_239009 [Aspergillus varians]
MRFRIINRLLLFPRPIARQSVRHISAWQAKDPAIFENSLEKTLEEHRSVNRKSLIRKVIARSDPPAPNRSILPSNKSAESGGSELPESPGSQSQLPSTVTQRSTLQGNSEARKRPKKSTKSANKTRTPIHRPIDLEVKRGKRNQCPWIDELEQSRSFSSGLSQLDAEVRALQKYLTPTAQEVEVADQVASDLTKLISNNADSFEPPRVIRTGFMMSNSVIKLTIPVPDQRTPTDDIRNPSASHSARLRRYDQFLDLIWHALEKCPTYELQLFHRRSRNLTVVHKPTGLVFRFHCAQVEPAHIEHIRDFHAEYPTLRPLYMAIRLILESRRLFGRTNLSMDSSGLQVFIAAFLKINHGRFQGDTGCAEALLAFFHTFGKEVDLVTTGIAADPPGFFNADSVEEACTMHDPGDLPAYLRGQRSLIKMKKSAVKRGNVPLASRLLLQAPGHYMENLGASCSRTTDLQFAFAEAHEALQSALEVWEPPEQLTRSTSILRRVLRANFDDFASRRAAILAGGTAL